MSEITNRSEARLKSIEKWANILERIEKIQTDIEMRCGFCDLARSRQIETPRIFKCNLCEPDAKKLCEKRARIRAPLETAYENTDTLLRKIRSLPVDLK